MFVLTVFGINWILLNLNIEVIPILLVIRL